MTERLLRAQVEHSGRLESVDTSLHECESCKARAENNDQLQKLLQKLLVRKEKQIRGLRRKLKEEKERARTNYVEGYKQGRFDERVETLYGRPEPISEPHEP